MSADDLHQAYLGFQKEHDELWSGFKEEKTEYSRQFRRSKFIGGDVSNVHYELDKSKTIETQLFKVERTLDKV